MVSSMPPMHDLVIFRVAGSGIECIIVHHSCHRVPYTFRFRDSSISQFRASQPHHSGESKLHFASSAASATTVLQKCLRQLLEAH